MVSELGRWGPSRGACVTDSDFGARRTRSGGGLVRARRDGEADRRALI
jgi:hypothetical protein